MDKALISPNQPRFQVSERRQTWVKDEFPLSRLFLCQTFRTYRQLHLSVYTRGKNVLIGCKHDMFCRQTFDVWSRQLLSTWFCFLSDKYAWKLREMKYERNAPIKNIHTTYHWRDSLLQRLSNFKCLAAKHVMSGTLLELKVFTITELEGEYKGHSG